MGHGGDDLVVPAEIRLAEQAHALRRDKGRQFHRVPEFDETRRLLAALSALPADADPLDWLASDGARLASAVVLATANRMGRELAAGPPIPDPGIVSLLGRLATTTHDLELRGPAASILGRLHDSSGLEPVVSPQLSLSDPGPLALLADLLRLPPGIDPLTWLRQERIELCARLALKNLLDAALPVPYAITMTPVLRTTDMHDKCSIGRQLAVRLRQLSEHVGGFAVDLDADFDMPTSPAYLAEGGSNNDTTTFTTWEGFERVVDSEGHSYVAWPADRGASKSPLPWRRRRWHERLRLVCAPALVRPKAGPTRLILESPNAALASNRRTAAGDIIPIPSPGLGPLRCEVMIPPAVDEIASVNETADRH